MPAHISIQIHGESAEEVRAELGRLFAGPHPVVEAVRAEKPAPVVDATPAEEAPVAEPEVVEEAPKRRGRPKKTENTAAAEAVKPAPEPVLAIQQGDDEPEDEEEEAEAAPTATRDEVRNAMKAYLQKFGEEPIMQHGPALLGGFPTVSAMPDDPALFGAAVARFGAAVEAGKADHGL